MSQQLIIRYNCDRSRKSRARVHLCLFLWLFQARNRISVSGRNVSGDSPGATN